MVRPHDRRTDEELRVWVTAILEREQGAGTFGTMTIHLESGRVTRVRTERSEVPEPVQRQ